MRTKRIGVVMLAGGFLAGAVGAAAKAPHPLRALAIPAAEVPPPCSLDTDARPMLMLPTDETWRRDLKMTVEWWTAPEPVEPELDAALSHMLRAKGEERPDRPAVLIVAMRFKDPQVAEEYRLRIEHRFGGDGKRVAKEGRTLLLQVPRLVSKECDAALWNEELARLRGVSN